MNTKLVKFFSLATLLTCGLANAQTKSDPFQEGLTPIVISQPEKEELESYMNKVDTRLKRVLELANSAYSGNSDKKVDARIAMYLDEIAKIIPDQALDLQRENGTLLRVALNQGVLLDISLRKESYFTHRFRETTMLFAINTAMQFYQTDVELFQNKRKLEEEYMTYAVLFAKYVDSEFDNLTKREAVLFYHESAQLLLNVLLAKGNILRLAYAQEIDDLQDILSKTSSNYTLLDTNKRKTIYASQAFRKVTTSLQQKWAQYGADKAKREAEDAVRKASSKVDLYFVLVGQNPQGYANTLIVTGFGNMERHAGYYDRVSIEATNAAHQDIPDASIVCSVDPLVRSGLYRSDWYGGHEPWMSFERPEDCFALYKSTKDQNTGNVAWNDPYAQDEAFVISVKPAAGGSFIFNGMNSVQKP